MNIAKVTKMEGDPGIAEKLYRLRLVLPDLSQSFVGNWLASLEKSIPPELFHDFDDLFDAPEKKSGRSGDAHVSGRYHIETPSRNQMSARENADSTLAIRQTAESGKSHELWLRAGELAPRGPEVHTWEVCHGLENRLLKKASESSPELRSFPLTHLRSNGLLESEIDGCKPNGVLPLLSNSAPHSQYTIVPESELVRDALCALQGLPAAVRKLEHLSRVYCTSPADKSAQKLSTLWTRSVTASALGKVLSVVARAGHVRCQLDAFVSFFLDHRVDPYEEMTDNASKVAPKASKKKKRAATQIKETAKLTRSDNGSDNALVSSEKEVPCHCLVNQAFAAAVKGILRGQSAALNTLTSSVSLRRNQETIVTSTDGALKEQDPGPVIGYGNRDISLLEFYLHTRELRVQLHALAFICLKREGKSFVGRTVSDAYLEEDLMDTEDNDMELISSANGRKSCTKGGGKCDPLVQSFEKFPRGADLLTYLYDQLMEVDPLHMELLRFLFESAYEPYCIFVQSWLYQAAVRDPYGEFIIEQADFSVNSSISKPKGKLLADPHPRDLKLRSGLYVPRFMENICTPLIRAGEQLQVLLKLAETCELAQQMANNARKSEAFWPQRSTESVDPDSDIDIFDRPGAEEVHERRITEVPVTLPNRSWLTSGEDEQAAHDSLSNLDGKSRRLGQVVSKTGPASWAMKEMQETKLTTCATADALGLTLDPRDPSELWFDNDPTRITKGAKSGKGSSTVRTLISSYQRGTSWQLWGLPQNPFLVQADVEDSAPTAYVYPSFSGTYQHWDVTAKPTLASTNFNHTFPLDTSGISQKYGRKSNIEPSWFPRLEAALNGQLFAGLDAQLQLPSWGISDFGSAGENAGEWGLTELHDQLPAQIDLKANDPLVLPPEDHSGPDALTSSSLNLSVMVDLELKEDRNGSRDITQSSQYATGRGPANWVQHMSDAFSPGAIHDATDDGVHEDDTDEIPLSVVISKRIADEILSQYQSVSTLTVRLFQEGLCLQDHYTALRRYYFMERGDWAEYFTTALCEHRWGPLGGQLRQMEVQGLLEAAFQKSSCEGDAYAERVYVTFNTSGYYCENSIHGSSKISASYVDPARLDAFDFIALQYRVDWPLSLILTNQSFSLYNVVFTFLMRVKLTAHALGDIWQRLQFIDRSLRKERASLSSQQQRSRFRTLQQFRQQIYHFVMTLQRYVESKLLNVVWSKFLQDLELEVNDMQDLEIVHYAYLEEAAEQCFLSTKTRAVKGCIDSIMQCVLDFSAHMRNTYWSREKLDLIDDNLFMQVHQVKKGFQASLRELHSYHMKREPSRTNLNDLWMDLDYNGFFTAALNPCHPFRDAVYLQQTRLLTVSNLAYKGHLLHVRYNKGLKNIGVFTRLSGVKCQCKEAFADPE